MVLGTILDNKEVAYNLTMVERCHETSIQILLSLSNKTSRHILYLLTESTPIWIVFQRRCFVYLHHILNQYKEYLLQISF